MSITIDGVIYQANWVRDSLKCKAEIVNGDASGRLQGSKAMFLDYVGTFYNYTGQLRREKDCSDAEWEALFFVLTSPINDHEISVPFGAAWNYPDDSDNTHLPTTASQTFMTSRFYISSVEKGLIERRMRTVQNYNQSYSNVLAARWENVYTVTFTAMSPQRVASNPNVIRGVG